MAAPPRTEAKRRWKKAIFTAKIVVKFKAAAINTCCNDCGSELTFRELRRKNKFGRWLQKCSACTRAEQIRKGKLRNPTPIVNESWQCKRCGKTGLKTGHCNVCGGAEEVEDAAITEAKKQRAAMEHALGKRRDVMRKGEYALKDLKHESKWGLVASIVVPKNYKRRSSQLYRPLVTPPDAATLHRKRVAAGCDHAVLPYTARNQFACGGCGSYPLIGSRVFGCDVCPWDVCPACADHLERMDDADSEGIGSCADLVEEEGAGKTDMPSVVLLVVDQVRSSQACALIPTMSPSHRSPCSLRNNIHSSRPS
jgi:hypothetical protein